MAIKHLVSQGFFVSLLLLAACEDSPSEPDGSQSTSSESETQAPTSSPGMSASSTQSTVEYASPSATVQISTASTTPSPLETEAPSPTTAPPEEPYRLTALQYLTRLSLDLRGRRPSVEEIEQVEANPEALNSLLQSFLADPGLGRQVQNLFADIYRTQLDFFPVPAASYGFTDAEASHFYASVGQEPLQMLAHIAVEDLPYTDLVTADWTMANEILAQAWGDVLDYPSEGSGWQPSKYTDTRPDAGVLSTNALWWRYPSDGTNYNRGRANALSRILLCNDLSTRQVTFDSSLDLTDPEQVNNAVQTNSSCINCHATLDPLGSYLFGFQYVAKEDPLDASWYHPERERMWMSTTEVQPAFYGQPGFTLRDLGQQIAADPRYPECVTEQLFEALLDVESGIETVDALRRHREAMLRGGMTLKALIGSIVNDPSYYSAATGTFHQKLVKPQLLASQIEALTGYRFTVGGYDMMSLDQIGLRSLAGGSNGTTGASGATGPTPSMLLVQERLAQAAAWHVVQYDQSAELPRLFSHIDFTETPDSNKQAMALQLQNLHLRLFAHRVLVDGPEVQAGLSLWNDLHNAGASIGEAWSGVLSVLLRDPDFIFY